MSYSDTLTDSGEVSLVGICEVPEYALAHVITAGPTVRTPFDQAPDLVVKVGWFQFGDQVDIGLGTTAYWQDPIWINGMYWQWAMPAGDHVNTSRLRYWFSPGTEVLLFIGP